MDAAIWLVILKMETKQLKIQDAQKVIIRLSKDFDENDLRAGLIKHWAEINKIKSQKLERLKKAVLFIEKSNSNEAERVLKALNSSNDKFDLKELEGAFELLIDKHRKKKQGAVYTPDYIIDYLITSSLQMTQEFDSENFRFCDPACGSGGFLIRTANKLFELHRINHTEAFEKHISGIDNDPWAIEHAKCLIELYLTKLGYDARNIRLNLLCKDALLTSSKEILEQLKAENGFDLLATNPPYVKLQNLEGQYRDDLVSAYPSFVKGSFSLAPLFLIAGVNFLSRRGRLAYVTQNNLFTSLSGEPIREYLQHRKLIKRIVDFGHQHLFDNASAYTCLIFLTQEQNDHFEYDAVSKPVDMQKLNSCIFSRIKTDTLNFKKWRLAKSHHKKHLNRLENDGTPLGELVDIKVGIATLKDCVYFVTQKNGKCFGRLPTGEEREIEEEITLPLIKVSEMSCLSDLNGNRRRIIYPYKKIGKSFVALQEQELEMRYPKAYAYLCLHKELLNSRSKGKLSVKPWYAWGRIQGMEANGPKLLTKTFSKGPMFIYDESDALYCNGYGLFPKKADLFESFIDLQLLAKILNSKIMDYYIRLTSFQIDGDYQCFQKNFIEQFHIKKISKQQAQNFISLNNDEEIDGYLSKIYEIPLDDISEIVPLRS